jgi:hypothetical protein
MVPRYVILQDRLREAEKQYQKTRSIQSGIHSKTGRSNNWQRERVFWVEWEGDNYLQHRLSFSMQTEANTLDAISPSVKKKMQQDYCREETNRNQLLRPDSTVVVRKCPAPRWTAHDDKEPRYLCCIAVSSVSVRYPLWTVSAAFTARRIPVPPRRTICYLSTLWSGTPYY